MSNARPARPSTITIALHCNQSKILPDWESPIKREFDHVVKPDIRLHLDCNLLRNWKYFHCTPYDTGSRPSSGWCCGTTAFPRDKRFRRRGQIRRTTTNMRKIHLIFLRADKYNKHLHPVSWNFCSLLGKHDCLLNLNQRSTWYNISI